MKKLEIVTELPRSWSRARYEYDRIIEDARSHPAGSWRPWECSNTKERDSIKAGVYHRGRRCHARGLVVYVATGSDDEAARHRK